MGEFTVFGMVEALHRREEGVGGGGRVHAVEELHAEDGERDSHAGRHWVTLSQELIDSDGHRAAH